MNPLSSVWRIWKTRVRFNVMTKIPKSKLMSTLSHYFSHTFTMALQSVLVLLIASMANDYGIILFGQKRRNFHAINKSTGHHPTQLCFSFDSFPDISLPIMTIHVTTAKPWSPNMTPIIIFMEWGNGSMIFDTASGNIVYNIYIIYDNYWLWLYGGLCLLICWGGCW